MMHADRLPLLLPVTIWVAGLACVRSDALPVAVAVLLLAGLLSALLWWCPRMAAVLLVSCLWGVADLLLDARDMQVPDAWLANATDITAVIESVQRQPAYTRLLVGGARDTEGRRSSGRLLLYLHRSRDGTSLMPGDRIRVVARLHRPRNYMNPGAFDYRAWCFDRHIALQGSASQVRLLGRHRSWLAEARQHIRHAIETAGVPGGGMVQALLLADRSRLAQSAVDAFAATGTMHLLAISGMHIGLAASWLFVLCRWLLTRSEVLIVALPVRSISLLAGLVGALCYAALAGWPLPAVRAGAMLAAGVLAWVLAVRAEPLNTLLAALLLILMFDPAAIASLSLWLSFLATAAILSLAPPRRESRQAPLRSLLWVSLIAMLATLPLILTVFGRLPLYGLPANMLLVPLYGLLVLPLSLAGEIAAVTGFGRPAAWAMQLAAQLADAGVRLAGWFASLPYGHLWVAPPSPSADALYMAGMACAGWLLLRRRSAVALFVLMLTLALYLLPSGRDVSGPRWLVWDVGQGASSTLLLPGGKVVVADVPGRAGSRFNGGTRVAAALRSLGLTHVDVLILSHAQSDHLGGALSLMRQVNRTGSIWLADVPAAHADARVRAIVREAGRRHIPVRWLARGERLTITHAGGSADVRVLWPPRNYAPANDNNASLVLTVRPGNGARLLWPGDIEAAAERAILAEEGDMSPVTAMLMPHHGSRTSSSPAFIESFRPRVAVAQAGHANRYGFPDARVLRRYRAVDSRVFDTARDGALMIDWPATAERPRVRSWRRHLETAGPGRRDLALQWWRGHL